MTAYHYRSSEVFINGMRVDLSPLADVRTGVRAGRAETMALRASGRVENPRFRIVPRVSYGLLAVLLGAERQRARLAAQLDASGRPRPDHGSPVFVALGRIIEQTTLHGMAENVVDLLCAAAREVPGVRRVAAVDLVDVAHGGCSRAPSAWTPELIARHFGAALCDVAWIPPRDRRDGQ